MRGEATRKIVAARTASWLALRSEGRRSHGRGILYRFMDAHHWGTHQTPQRARRYTPYLQRTHGCNRKPLRREGLVILTLAKEVIELWIHS